MRACIAFVWLVCSCAISRDYKAYAADKYGALAKTRVVLEWIQMVEDELYDLYDPRGLDMYSNMVTH